MMKSALSLVLAAGLVLVAIPGSAGSSGRKTERRSAPRAAAAPAVAKGSGASTASKIPGTTSKVVVSAAAVGLTATVAVPAGAGTTAARGVASPSR